MQTDTALLSVDQALIFAIFGFAMVAFVWGRLRYDVVALTALVAAVLVGVVKADDAFMGFSQSAVITVALVLVLARALQDSGAIDRFAGLLGLSDRLPAFGGADRDRRVLGPEQRRRAGAADAGGAVLSKWPSRC